MTLSRARWARYDRDSSGLYTTLGPGNSNCRQRGILIVANHRRDQSSNRLSTAITGGNMGKQTKVEADSEELEKFQYFLFEMDDILDDFLMEAGTAGYQSDFSLDSIPLLEAYLLANLGQEVESRLKNKAARYLGEVFRKDVGGKWELSLKDPNYLYYKLPVIIGYSNKPIEFCPVEVIENLAFKEGKGMLRRAVDAHLMFKK